MSGPDIAFEYDGQSGSVPVVVEKPYQSGTRLILPELLTGGAAGAGGGVGDGGSLGVGDGWWMGEGGAREMS